MKKVLLVTIALILTAKIYGQTGGVSVSSTNANPHASAMLDVQSTTKGFLVPRMTKAERDLISAPATSLIIYQTDNLAGFYYYDGLTWKIMGSGAGGTETDPVFTASPAFTIAAADITNWNLAKSWGNHAGLYRPIAYVPDWSEILNKPNLSLVAASNDYNDLLNKPWINNSSSVYKTAGNVGIGTSKPKSKLVVQSDSLSADGAAFFVLKNNKGDTVMAVYNDGVIFFINNNLVKATQGKGILVKSTSTGGKLPQQEYFRITNDSTVLYVNDNPAKATQGKGILVKSTSTGGKAVQNNYMSISPDSTVFYINDSPTKATQGKGILVKSTSTGGKNSTNHDYMRISPDSTNFYIRENSGNGKGFAVKTLGTNNKDLLNISSDSTAFSTNDNEKHVVFKKPTQNNPLLNVDGSVRVSNSTDTLRGSIKWNGERFAGNVTGNQTGTFLMSFGAPALSNVTLTAMTKTTIAASSNVTDDGGGYVFLKGFCWNTTGLPTRKSSKVLSGEDEGAFTDTLKNLTCATTYHVRAYAINASSTSYSDEVTFLATFAPTVTTTTVSSITESSANCVGNVIDDGCLAVTARGVCWNTTGTPTINDSHTTDGIGTGIYISTLNSLSLGLKYYYRAYATNSKGTSYGNVQNFIIGAVDYDGNVYDTVKIGTQVWLKQSLKTTHYSNGDPITLVTNNATWASLTTEAYCWYNNDYAAYGVTYGALYNWYAVSDSRNICPVGWHVPNDTEWNTLITYLGSNSGGKMKETGITHWSAPNTGATNESGFNGLPSGFRQEADGSFGYVGYYFECWGSTESNASSANDHELYYNNTGVYSVSLSKRYGFVVRCIKN